MGSIQVMPPSLANQIAAGEVVERPASVVKELVENSLDAGASRIVVQVDEGGIERIVVQDDGSGMDAEDARLAFARHATSKVRSPRDLFHITTLGFRGEALASIAAVARVELCTRLRDADAGVRLRMHGSQWIGEAEPVGMAPGTRIEVRDLFFNTPARLKYLRAVATEQARCLEVVHRAALGRPDVAFRFEAAGRLVFQTPGNGRLEEVLAALYGPAEAKQFLPLVGETPDYRLTGFVGRPQQGRSNRAHGHLFINDRPIRNHLLHQAVVSGYRGRLMINRHPMYVIRLHMDPTLVDVNIHPHKAEVRLSEERDVTRLVEDSVRTALDSVLLVPEMKYPASHRASEQAQADKEQREFRWQSQLALERPAEFQSSRGRRSPSRPDRSVEGQLVERVYGAVGTEGTSAEPADPHVAHKAPGPLGLQQPGAPLAEEAAGERADRNPGAEPLEAAAFTTQDRRRALSRLRPIGQALNTYIVAEDGESLYLIDQHAAHERVLYERFKAQMQADEIRVLPLLAPIPLTLSEPARALVSEQRRVLSAMGLELEDFGGREVVLRTVPEIWEGLDAGALAEEVLESLKEHGAGQDVREVIQDRVITRACKAAVKAHQRLSAAEMEALCASLAEAEDPFHCPHGRPVLLKWTNRDLEKGFKRIV
ncbi:DNA mismatch repair endonuclease MutL [Alicyclobacillus kakegawensis]|uniref:DNA mismatch repair endonuclease MutL n=1 Tax=Alicyclobacillus kakegawensis TaxID=392012 RepID=UPI000ACCD979|nr:DNA mismatch repair endonuclease MutL [Alicyclobacillus kakegawensis]